MLNLFIILATLFALPLFSTVFGALTGLVVGWFFADTILPLLQPWAGDATMWQIGATLGFVGGFFRTTVTQGR